MKPKSQQFPFRLHVDKQASYPFRTYEAAKAFARRQFPKATCYIIHDGERIWSTKDGHETESFQPEKDTA